MPCGRSTTPQQWEDYSRYNKERADAEMQASNRLREAIHHTLQQTANDLEAQKIATEYAFRRRIHEFERAKDELEWQKKNVSLQEQSWLAVRILKKTPRFGVKGFQYKTCLDFVILPLSLSLSLSLSICLPRISCSSRKRMQIYRSCSSEQDQLPVHRLTVCLITKIYWISRRRTKCKFPEIVYLNRISYLH